MKLSKSIALATALAISIASLACSRLGGSSPTNTLKAFYEGTQKKDAEAIKKTLSKGTLEMLEGFAKAQGKSLDESLKSGLASDNSSGKMPETRNEKIDGDKATLEVKNDKTGQWESVPFVKEEGNWKIAFDQMFRDAFKNMGNTNSNSDGAATGNSAGTPTGNANANSNANSNSDK
jgi:hypothetical protein